MIHHHHHRHFNNNSNRSYGTRVTDSRRRQQQKRDRIVNLTDSGRHNNMRVVRDLQDDGTYRLRQVNWDGSLIPEENPYPDPNAIGAVEGQQANGLPIFIAHEDKGSGYEEPYQPPDIEPGYEEHLENTGATIINSTTYYPGSKTTISKRSMTHDEIADERGYVTR